MNKKINEKRNIVFDLSKYILSIMVVAIHSELFPNHLYPWLRIAVPLFFIISSYFLFFKVQQHPNNKNEIVRTFIKRNLELYVFWFVVSLPFTIYKRRVWWTGDIFHFFFTVLKNLLFSSTFTASWYITASIWACIILCKVKISKEIAVPCLIYIYIYCAVYVQAIGTLCKTVLLKIF